VFPVQVACCTLANISEVVENLDRIVAANAIPALVEALKLTVPAVQRDACRGLANLACNIEYGDMILKAGALSRLVGAVKADNHEAQRMAAMCLCNLCTSVKNQPTILETGVLDPVIDKLNLGLNPKVKSDHEAVRYCLLIIANLAVCTENHRTIMSVALPTIAAFAKHRDVKCRQYAILVLGNLCANQENLPEIVATGALKTLITYAFQSAETSGNVQYQAIAALRGLSTHPTLRMMAVREGALEPLTLAAKSDSIEIQREAAATLCNLAMAEENKVRGTGQTGQGVGGTLDVHRA
jgi:hypothetical protein